MRHRYFGKGYRGDSEGHRLNALGRGSGRGSRGGRTTSLSSSIMRQRSLEPSRLPQQSSYTERPMAPVEELSTTNPPGYDQKYREPVNVSEEVTPRENRPIGVAAGERAIKTPGVPPRLSDGFFGGV